MGGLALQIVSWAVWASLTAAVIMIDAKLRRDRLAAEGSVDFTDTNPVPYLLLGLLCGFLSLPLYFYSSRKSFVGALIGFALSIATFVVTVVIMVVVSVVLRGLG